jgi:hypothetical protein
MRVISIDGCHAMMMRMRNLVLTVALCALSSAAAAPAAARKVSLDAALSMSELVVTIQLDTPHTTKVSVPVPSPERKPEKECGSYDSYVVTGKVVEVVHPTKMRFTVVSPDDRIVVFPGNLAMNVDLTQRVCSDGTSKSPIYDHFASPAPLEDGAVRTALLRWQNGYGWTEAVAGSWLDKPPSQPKLAAVDRMHFEADPARHDALCVTAADCVQDDLSCEPCGACVEHPPIARSAVTRYVAVCHEAKKPKPGHCGSCGDVKDPFGAPTRVVCRAMRCAMEVVKPRPTHGPLPGIPANPAPVSQEKTLDAPAPPAIPRG